MKPKDIFSLAVRLLGLVFLYLGLKDLTPAVKQILDMGTAENPDRDDIFYGIINGPLPVLFDLLIAVWLLRGRMLIRWAYPEETSKSGAPAARPVRPAMPVPESAPAPAAAGMQQADDKLAALLEKPRENRAE
jgi:hypothetical protein